MSTNPPPGYNPPPYPAAPPPSYPSAPVYPSGMSYPAAGPVTGWAPAGPAPGLTYPGFWYRFLGYLVDSLLLIVVELAVTVPLVFIPLIQFYRDHPFTSGQPAPALPADLAGRFAILQLLGALVSALYYGGMVAWRGRTLGQQAVGARVVRAEDGGRLPAGRAFLRAIVFWGPGVLSIVPGLGTIAGLAAFIALLSVAWDSRKQGWHDKLGRALVVRPVQHPAGYVR